MDLADLRSEYEDDPLDDATAVDDPLGLLATWLQEAIERGAIEPNAMTLATVDVDGAPAARMVLLRAIHDGDLVFYTNLDSPKGLHLRREPRCALVFWWPELERQVRVTGRAAPVPRDSAAAYFATRPRGSQLGAWASPQSRPIPDRAHLEARLDELATRFEGQEVPLPPHWGGYAVTPVAIEFWRGRPSRLHDRLRFEREGRRWRRSRLAP
jgi:pyridoxamine 5'-phosphate oxidase